MNKFDEAYEELSEVKKSIKDLTYAETYAEMKKPGKRLVMTPNEFTAYKKYMTDAMKIIKQVKYFLSSYDQIFLSGDQRGQISDALREIDISLVPMAFIDVKKENPIKLQ